MKKLFRRPAEPPVPRRRLDSRRQVRNDSLEGTTAKVSFRRNQTLTGSRSPDLRSASELSSQVGLQSPRATVHHLKAHRRRLGLFLVLGVTASLLLIGVISQLSGSISVSLYGQVAPLAGDEKQRLESAVERYFDHHQLDRFRVFLNRERLIAYLASQDLRQISAVSRVEQLGWGRSHIELKAREPIASWTIGADRRYVDGRGVVFEHNYFATPRVKIRDDSGLSLKHESQATAVTSRRFLRFIGQAVNLLEQHEVKVATAVIPSNTTRQIDFMVGATRLKMTIDRPVGEQAEDAARAWSHLQTKRQPAKYIDVRVSRVAYYR